MPAAAQSSSSLWSASTTPATASFSDSSPYEIGIKFYADEPGAITAIRFYKGAGNTGTHVAHLWDSQGNLLSTATFTSETASGWQQVNLPTPVQITANTVYTASYWDPNGHYALNRPYFTTAYNNGPLHAPANGTDGPNAVFLYGSSGFPTQTYDASNYWVDVVFTPAGSSDSLWSASTTPATASFSDSSPYEIGVKFYADEPGAITAIRFYKGAGNTGTHVAHLWDSQGNLLSTATFTSETASGWQQVNLPTPVQITANTVYTASYWDPNGHYALNRPYFTTAYNNAPLHAPANGTDGPNAVFLYGSSGFPTGTYDASNYWVDVVFTPAGSSDSLWSTSTTPATASFSDSSPYEIGVKFYADEPGAITAIRFYKGAGNTGTHVAHLWDSQGNLLSTATFTSETASGWQQVNLPTPVQITANTVYTASYWDPNGHYALNRPYFTTAYNNAPLHAPANGTDGPNAVSLYGSSGFPTQTYEESNYWVDVVFSPAATGGSPPATMTLSLAPTSLSFGVVTIGLNSILPVVVTNTGTGSVTVSQASITGAGLSVGGSSLPLTLSAGQNTTFDVTFAPTLAGSATGSLSIISNATNSPSVASISETGAGSHSVSLAWAASTSSGITGYNVYRGAVSGGPYTKLNASLLTTTSYTDTTVAAGQTYYYVTTAVNSGGVQSAYSNQATAVVPSP